MPATLLTEMPGDPQSGLAKFVGQDGRAVAEELLRQAEHLQGQIIGGFGDPGTG